MNKPAGWDKLKAEWSILSHYQRFESSVAFVLTLVIGLIVLVALFRLASSVIAGLLLGALEPLDYKVFRAVFGEIMTLLIALLALARKFIILDVHDMEAGQLQALAAVTLALGVAYWLIRDRDTRLERAAKVQAHG